MAIVFFTEEGRSYEPKVSIRMQGQIGLSQGAVSRYNLKDGDCVLLGYDKDERKVVMKLVDCEQKGAKKITIRNGNASIGAKSFLDYFDVPYKEETKSFNIEKEGDLLVFCI